MILHNIGRAHFLSEEGGGGYRYDIHWIHNTKTGRVPGYPFHYPFGYPGQKYPEIRALCVSAILLSPGVRPSVTFCIQMAEDIVKLLSRPVFYIPVVPVKSGILVGRGCRLKRIMPEQN